MIPKPRTRHERGNALVMTIFALFALVSIATLVINQILIYEVQAKLQNAADAAALAGISVLRDGGDPDLAIERARAVGRAHHVRGATVQDVEIADSDIEIGWYEFDGGGFVLEPGPETPPALRISITMEGDASPNSTGALRLFFSGIMQSLTGSSVARIASDAVAVARPRDFVILQDVTYSFVEEFEYARDAGLAFVELLANSYGGLGDRVGIVTFARQAYKALDLTPLASGYEEITDYLGNEMEVCRSTSNESGTNGIDCRGSGTADGIDAATEVFEESSSTGTDRVLVLVTDGRPCHLELGLPEAVETGETLALDAAQRAADVGINIFVVELTEPTPGNTHLCMQPNSEFNLALAGGFGFGVTTDDPAELEEKLAKVAKKLPMRLVN